MDSDSNKTFKIYLLSINELFWMWLASVSPIIFGSLFIRMKFNDTGYLNILLNSIEVDTAFAYVATMIAPFLFIIGTTKKIKYGRFLLFVSLVITAIISSSYSEYKIEAAKRDNLSLNAASTSQSSPVKKSYKEITPPNKVPSETTIPPNRSTNNSLINRWNHMGLKGQVLLACYFTSLLIWYYTIYLKYLEAPDIQKGEVIRVKGFMDVITEQTKGH